jgi:hypothetical protein
MVGWQVTLWRSGDAWCAHRTRLDLGAPTPALTAGHRLSLRRARRLLRAVERAELWTAPPWPFDGGADGYTVLLEGWRTGQAVVRESWCPDPVLRDRAWELFDAFGALHPPWWMPWRRVPL